MSIHMDRKMVEVAANRISSAFVWSRTPQGWEYWKDVYENLQRLMLADIPEDEDKLEVDPFSVGG